MDPDFDDELPFEGNYEPDNQAEEQEKQFRKIEDFMNDMTFAHYNDEETIKLLTHLVNFTYLKVQGKIDSSESTQIQYDITYKRQNTGQSQQPPNPVDKANSNQTKNKINSNQPSSVSPDFIKQDPVPLPIVVPENLDIQYILYNLAVMGFPDSSSFLSVYKNSLEKVRDFFQTQHKLAYIVYNLCAEPSMAYKIDSFSEQATYPSWDDIPVTFGLIVKFCEDVHLFMQKRPDFTVIVHCSNGRGRSGLMIACLLIKLGVFRSALYALQYFGILRTKEFSGITQPSQLRWVYYYEQFQKQNLPYESLEVFVYNITKITITDPPKVQLKDFQPGIVIKEDAQELRIRFDLFFNLREKSLSKKFEQQPDGTWVYEPEMELQDTQKLSGDVQVIFMRRTITGEEEFCSVWFHTQFIDSTGEITFRKNDIDKPEKVDQLPESFSIKIELRMISEEFNNMLVLASQTANKPGFENFDKDDEKYND